MVFRLVFKFSLIISCFFTCFTQQFNRISQVDFDHLYDMNIVSNSKNLTYNISSIPDLQSYHADFKTIFRNSVHTPIFHDFAKKIHDEESKEEVMTQFCRMIYETDKAMFDLRKESCMLPMGFKIPLEIPSKTLINLVEGEQPFLVQGLPYGGMNRVCTQIRRNEDAYFDGALGYCRIPGETTLMKFTSGWNVVDARKNTLLALLETGHGSTRENSMWPHFDPWIMELEKYEAERTADVIWEDIIRKLDEVEKEDPNIFAKLMKTVMNFVKKMVSRFTNPLEAEGGLRRPRKSIVIDRPYH
eukprot:GDKJ01032560.1.p1 GENE.GDKJ01032560.1~~GDKJ01032560.1.p1  ORF type:complete len:301 (+),score=50.93 GDKJ01032560.1:14-916(+)